MLRFACKYLWLKKAKLLLVLLSIVISASVALLAYNISRQVRDGIVNTAAHYDLIIGPAGSATQLAMNTMFFTDAPLGTIPYALVEELQASPQVNQVVPFTMGDSYLGAKVVGTTQALLDAKPLAVGALFEGVYEAVLGADVAARHGLRVGDQIVTSHGLSGQGAAHTASPLTIVGILARTHTAYDGALFTSVESVWAAHGIGHDAAAHEHDEHDGHEHAQAGEVCAILVKTKSFNAYYTLSDYYGADASLLVINPASVLREVLSNVDLSAQIVYVLCGVILVMNIFVIFAITLLNLYDARKEIALMRLIGIGMDKINRLFLVQNAIVGLAATLLAFGASMLCLRWMGGFVAARGIVLAPTRVYPLEWAIMVGVFAISVLPTFLLTAFMARRDSLDAGA